MSSIKNVSIYSAWFCEKEPGPGGYGVVLTYNTHRKELAGSLPHTSGNYIHLLAVISGIQALNTRCNVIIHCQSTYLVQSITVDWADRWHRADWQPNQGEKVQHIELWKTLHQACREHIVTFGGTKHHTIGEYQVCYDLAKQAVNQYRPTTTRSFERPTTQAKPQVKSQADEPKQFVNPVPKFLPKKRTKGNSPSQKRDRPWLDEDQGLPPPSLLHDARDSVSMLEKCPHGVLKIKKCAICDPLGFRSNSGW